MTNHRSFNPSGMMNDYANLRTIPALLSMFFAIAGLFLYGAFGDTLTFVWFDYTLTTGHALGGSFAVYLVAFASSQTRSLEHYASWEQITIAVGPILMVGYEFFPYVPELVNYADPWTQILAFLISFASYAVAVR